MADLLDVLNDSAVDSVFELCGALLRFVEEHVREFRAGNLPEHRARRRVFEAAALETVTSLWRSSDVEDEVFRDLVRSGRVRGLVDPVIAHALADVLASVHEAQFAAGFGGQEVRRGEGAPVPVALDFDWRKCLGEGGVGSLPDNLPEEPRPCRGLRLARNLRGRTLVVDGRARDALTGFVTNPVVAAAVPNLAPQSELTWDPGRGPCGFCNVRPRDPVRQEKLLDALLDEGARSGAQVLVFPELCATRTWLDALPAKLTALGGAAPPVLVAGSLHRRDGRTQWVNEAVVFVHGRPLAAHYKLSPFPWKRGGQTFVEEIRPGEEIRLFLSNDALPFSVLICKDLLDPEIVRSFVELRVKLMLVPSYSEKTDALVNNARTLTTQAQTLTVLVTPPSTPEAYAARRCRPVVVTVPTADESKVPTLPETLPARAFLGVYRVQPRGAIQYRVVGGTSPPADG